MKVKTLTTLASTMLLALFLTACEGNDPAAQEANTPAAAEQEDHEHGEGTHTHELAADTAGTYTDTTGAFFSPEDSAEAAHEHGSDTHEH